MAQSSDQAPSIDVASIQVEADMSEKSPYERAMEGPVGQELRNGPTPFEAMDFAQLWDAFQRVVEQRDDARQELARLRVWKDRVVGGRR
jgi:hypothetical protein